MYNTCVHVYRTNSLAPSHLPMTWVWYCLESCQPNWGITSTWWQGVKTARSLNCFEHHMSRFSFCLGGLCQWPLDDSTVLPCSLFLPWHIYFSFPLTICLTSVSHSPFRASCSFSVKWWDWMIWPSRTHETPRVTASIMFIWLLKPQGPFLLSIYSP